MTKARPCYELCFNKAAEPLTGHYFSSTASPLLIRSLSANREHLVHVVLPPTGKQSKELSEHRPNSPTTKQCLVEWKAQPR
ncbi:MAG: hypothetical protein JST93_00845 [Acidobacteria bacterium]|nr:hypothetical protein [Acidobacteriota bacterium]